MITFAETRSEHVDLDATGRTEKFFVSSFTACLLSGTAWRARVPPPAGAAGGPRCSRLFLESRSPRRRRRPRRTSRRLPPRSPSWPPARCPDNQPNAPNDARRPRRRFKAYRDEIPHKDGREAVPAEPRVTGTSSNSAAASATSASLKKPVDASARAHVRPEMSRTAAQQVRFLLSRRSAQRDELEANLEQEL